MPTYQYACTACGHELEAVQSFSDEALTQCPACEGRLRKVFSAVGIVFKGSGFYRTDSRGDKSAATVPATPKESVGGSGDSGTSSSGTPSASTSSSGGSDKSGSDKGGSDKGGSDKGGTGRGGSDKGGSTPAQSASPSRTATAGAST